MPRSDAEQDSQSRPIRSVLRALAILDALAAQPQGATPKALSAELDLHLSTTYHLLNTLVTGGYVTRSADNRLFHLGPRIPHLHHGLREGLRPHPAMLPFVSALQQATGETVHLVRLLGDDAVAAALLAGSRPDAVPAGYLGLGSPAHTIAAGLVLLAWRSPAQIAAYLARAKLDLEPPFPVMTPAHVRHRLERTRQDGYALDPGPLVGCVAAPVFGADGTVDVALAVMAPTSRYARTKDELIRAVVTLARAASELLAVDAARADGEAESPSELIEVAQAMASLSRHHPTASASRRLHKEGVAANNIDPA